MKLNIGETIKKLRKEREITQEEFAHFLGAIFKEWWEHRERYPEIEPFKSYLQFYTTICAYFVLRANF